MQLKTTLALFGFGLTQLTSAQYHLQDDYMANGFFSQFSFFTGNDPTHGYVNYVDKGTAQNNGYISTNGGTAYIGVDHTGIAGGRGRNSVRLTSNKSYNHGLVILQLDHMPDSTCGTWPAFWMVGPNWPNSGEIDIIEGVNGNNVNQMTLHTSDGCSLNGPNGASGTLVTQNCYVNAPGQGNNVGCAFQSTNHNSYGSGFNAAGGGIYATQWVSEGIFIWFWPNGHQPSDVLSGSPNPANWGSPTATFYGSGCNWDSHFQNQQIVFDITFCGDWAGAVWGNSCSSKGSSCQSYVQNNPRDFQGTYWSVRSLKVYELNGQARANGVLPHGITDSPDGVNSTVPTPTPSSVAPKATTTTPFSSKTTAPPASLSSAGAPSSAATTATATVVLPPATTHTRTVPAGATSIPLQAGEFGRGSKGIPESAPPAGSSSAVALQSSEFGTGSKGIPESQVDGQGFRRRRRHLVHHQKRAAFEAHS